MKMTPLPELPGWTIGRQAGANIRIGADGRWSRSYEWVVVDPEGYTIVVSRKKADAVKCALWSAGSRDAADRA